jgi:hypothetical protein
MKVALTMAVTYWLLIGILGTSAEVSYLTCAESKSWVRPNVQIQSKIWNDPRYSCESAYEGYNCGKGAYEWTHHFVIWYGGASGQYHLMNLTGLHTATDLKWLCSERDREEKVSTGKFVELWLLLYHVKQIQHEGPIYTVTVDQLHRGVEVIEFPRAEKGALTFRLADANGKILDVITEGVTPGTFGIK